MKLHNDNSLEALLALARAHADQVEIRKVVTNTSSVSFSDAHLDEIKTSIRQKIFLRLLRDGKQGSAVTCNLIDMNEFVKHALHSLEGGVEAPFDLPLTRDLPNLATYEASVESLSNEAMVEESERVCEYLSKNTSGEIGTQAGRHISHMRLLNSQGTDLSTDTTAYHLWLSSGYPGGASGVGRLLMSKDFQPLADEVLETIATRYNQGDTIVKPKDGLMQVLFTPGTMLTLLWRLSIATSGFSVYRKTSPLLGRIGEKIISDKLTIYNDPHDDTLPDAETFDNEGVPTRKLILFENGVLRNFYYDLKYAAKCKAQSTGNGDGSGPVLNHMRIEPGEHSIEQLIAGMERGLVLEGAMGAHSGNLNNGDYSIGVTPAYYVENGKVVGRVKDAMAAGNVYETLSHVAGISRERGLAHMNYGGGLGHVPAVLCDNVSVTIKQ
ncbi:MAG: TldD/PmbA family protein [Candidatus Cloacimonetes bacterium]|nr:TldD/PmbA family protein [Candidatus Cloacimonadota bacterium]